MRDSGGLSAPSTSVLSTSELPNSEDLSSSSLWKQDFIDFLESTRGGAETGHRCVTHRPAAVVHGESQHLCLNDPPPFLNSQAHSFQQKARTPLLVHYLPARTQTCDHSQVKHSRHKLTRREHSPLVVAELLLHQEQVGLQLVPLKDDVSHLLLGETRPVRILLLLHWLIQGRRCRRKRTGLMGQKWGLQVSVPKLEDLWEALKLSACLQALCRFCPAVWTGIQSLWFSPSGRPPCRPSSPPSSSAGPAERSACAAAPCSFSWNVPIAPEATNTDKYYAQIQLREFNWTPTKQVLSQIQSSRWD